MLCSQVFSKFARFIRNKPTFCLWVAVSAGWLLWFPLGWWVSAVGFSGWALLLLAGEHQDWCRGAPWRSQLLANLKSCISLHEDRLCRLLSTFICIQQPSWMLSSEIWVNAHIISITHLVFLAVMRHATDSLTIEVCLWMLNTGYPLLSCLVQSDTRWSPSRLRIGLTVDSSMIFEETRAETEAGSPSRYLTYTRTENAWWLPKGNHFSDKPCVALKPRLTAWELSRPLQSC